MSIYIDKEIRINLDKSIGRRDYSDLKFSRLAAEAPISLMSGSGNLEEFLNHLKMVYLRRDINEMRVKTVCIHSPTQTEVIKKRLFL